MTFFLGHLTWNHPLVAKIGTKDIATSCRVHFYCKAGGEGPQHGPKGPQQAPKGPSPPQELEGGAC